MRDLAEALGFAYDLAPGRPGEIERSCLDRTAAAAELGWQAAAPLADRLHRTLGASPAPP